MKRDLMPTSQSLLRLPIAHYSGGPLIVCQPIHKFFLDMADGFIDVSLHMKLCAFRAQNPVWFRLCRVGKEHDVG